MLLGFNVQHGTVGNACLFEDSAVTFSSMAEQRVTLSGGFLVGTPSLRAFSVCLNVCGKTTYAHRHHPFSNMSPSTLREKEGPVSQKEPFFTHGAPSQGFLHLF